MKLRDLNIQDRLPAGMNLDKEINESDALLHACRKGDIELASILLRNGADPNRDPNAFLDAPPPIQALLLKHGADIAQRFSGKERHDLLGASEGMSFTAHYNKTLFDLCCERLNAMDYGPQMMLRGGVDVLGLDTLLPSKIWHKLQNARRDWNIDRSERGLPSVLGQHHEDYTLSPSEAQINLRALDPSQNATAALLLNAVFELPEFHEKRKAGVDAAISLGDLGRITQSYLVSPFSDIIPTLAKEQQDQFSAYCKQASELINAQNSKQAAERSPTLTSQFDQTQRASAAPTSTAAAATEEEEERRKGRKRDS